MGTKKILIVDDIPEYVKTLEVLLWGKYEVISAYSLEEAQKKFDEYQPDGLIVDLRLNDKDVTNMDGERLLEWVKERDKYIPVIVMSAYATADIATRMIRKGANYYFAKPFNVEEFLKAVDNALK